MRRNLSGTFFFFFLLERKCVYNGITLYDTKRLPRAIVFSLYTGKTREYKGKHISYFSAFFIVFVREVRADKYRAS